MITLRLNSLARGSTGEGDWTSPTRKDWGGKEWTRFLFSHEKPLARLHPTGQR